MDIIFFKFIEVQYFLFTLSLFCMYVCILHGYVCVIVHMWSEEDLGESVLFFYHMGPKNWAGVFRLGGKGLCPRSHLTPPRNTSCLLSGFEAKAVLFFILMVFFPLSLEVGGHIFGSVECLQVCFYQFYCTLNRPFPIWQLMSFSSEKFLGLLVISYSMTFLYSHSRNSNNLGIRYTELILSYIHILFSISMFAFFTSIFQRHPSLGLHYVALVGLELTM